MNHGRGSCEPRVASRAVGNQAVSASTEGNARASARRRIQKHGASQTRRRHAHVAPFATNAGARRRSSSHGGCEAFKIYPPLADRNWRDGPLVAHRAIARVACVLNGGVILSCWWHAVSAARQGARVLHSSWRRIRPPPWQLRCDFPGHPACAYLINGDGSAR